MLQRKFILSQYIITIKFKLEEKFDNLAVVSTIVFDDQL